MGRLRLRFSAQAAMVGPVYPSLLVFTSSGWTALPTHASMSTGTAALLSSLSNCCTAVLPFQLLHCCPPFPTAALLSSLSICRKQRTLQFWQLAFPVCEWGADGAARNQQKVKLEPQWSVLLAADWSMSRLAHWLVLLYPLLNVHLPCDFKFLEYFGSPVV